jgi:hypothetical protein
MARSTRPGTAILRRVLLALACALAFALPPLLVGGIGIARAMHAASATSPAVSASAPIPPAYDPQKPTAVVVAGNKLTEISDLLGPYETLATSPLALGLIGLGALVLIGRRRRGATA